MQQISPIKVGNFKAAVTTDLRELFAHTHDVMSGSDLTSKQYPLDEQYEMFVVCEVAVKGDKDTLDMERTEENILELLRYLNEQGLRIPEIHPKIRRFSATTRAVALKLHLDRVRPDRPKLDPEALESLFLEPSRSSS